MTGIVRRIVRGPGRSAARWSALALVTLAALAMPAATRAQGGASSPREDVTFPHSMHTGLFPTCLGCHAGMPVNDAARAFPAAERCSGCHDGTTRRLVDWTPRAARGASLLRFGHPRHAEVAEAEDLACRSCHAVTDDADWMDVARPAPERCLSCHAHQAAPAHLSESNKCSTCHRLLAEALGLSDERIAALPKPPSHAGSDFLSTHGAAPSGNVTTCATCHARESCARCHVNAGRSPVIGQLQRDARVARIAARKAPDYPTPADHRRADFATTHGSIARIDAARCATCHARPSCATCHTGDGARDVLDQLPKAEEAAGRGVQLRRAAAPASRADWRSAPRPPRAAGAGAQASASATVVQVHPVGFGGTHGASAAAGATKCTGCHAQRECKDCHAGERNGRRFHVANFVSRHAPEAYGRDTECNTCHRTETFCRDCHRQTGLSAGVGSRSARYHNAQSNWLLQHGRAARQDLTSCTSCHQQTYCMPCHSGVGWRINPHGPDFDAVRVRERNPSACLNCHLKDPLGGN